MLENSLADEVNLATTYTDLNKHYLCIKAVILMLCI